MSETMEQLRNVVEALEGLKQASEREKEMPEALRTEIVGLCEKILKALGQAGGDGYPEPSDQKSLAAHFFGR